MFDRIGLANKQAVEFGYNYMKGWASIHGKQLLERYSLNAYTMVKKGWNVTFFDAEVGDAEARIVKAVLTEQNIAGHFRLAGVTVDADFVSVDVDSVDLWLFHGLLKGGYRPRVVAIEFNPNFAAGQLVTFQREWHAWTRRSAFGASAGAVHKVATMFGYTVVQMPSHEKGQDGKMPKYNMDMILVRSDLLTSCSRAASRRLRTWRATFRSGSIRRGMTRMRSACGSFHCRCKVGRRRRRKRCERCWQAPRTFPTTRCAGSHLGSM